MCLWTNTNINSYPIKWFGYINPEFIKLIRTNLIEFYENVEYRPGLLSIVVHCQNMKCEWIKQIVRSFHWHLAVAVRVLDSDEFAQAGGFVVSRIQIRFGKIWPNQTQDVETSFGSSFGLIKQGQSMQRSIADHCGMSIRQPLLYWHHSQSRHQSLEYPVMIRYANCTL